MGFAGTISSPFWGLLKFDRCPEPIGFSRVFVLFAYTTLSVNTRTEVRTFHSSPKQKGRIASAIRPLKMLSKMKGQAPSLARARCLQILPLNVSHWLTSPVSMPFFSQAMRCSDVPCVKLRDETWPRVSVSSPIWLAALIASSASP